LFIRATIGAIAEGDPDGSKAKSLGLVFGVAFAVMPMTQQATILWA
jgi:hypothetical protein